MFFFLCFYQLIDYIPRFFSGLSFQALVNIDLLYKPMQRIVLSSMPSASFSSFVLVTIFYVVLVCQSEEDRFQVEWKGISVMCLIFGLTVLQTTLTDLVLIGLMLICAVTSFIPKVRAMVIDHLSMQPSEIILIVWVGATWGYFPAFTVLIFARTLPKMLNMLSSSVNVERDSLHHRISNAMLAVSLLYCIWLNFSLLTPLGLLEFNPSKVIVTGGFLRCSFRSCHCMDGHDDSLPTIVRPRIHALSYRC